MVTLGTLGGLRVRAERGWFLLAVVVTLALAVRYFPWAVPGLSAPAYWAMAVAAAAGLFGSIVLHEIAHALVARAHGVASRGVTLAVLGARADMAGALPRPRAELLMAAAGPVANGVLACLALALTAGGWSSGWAPSVVGVLSFTAAVNVLLTAVNLLPVLPLDGGRMLRAVLWSRTADLPDATRTAGRIGIGFCLGLVVGGAVAIAADHRLGGVLGMVVGLYLYRRAHLALRVAA